MNTGELMAQIPRAAGQGDAELRQVLVVALRRLAIKKRIFDVGELWKLA
jgi:hypothetical protein